MKISQRAQAISPFFAMEFGKKAAQMTAQGQQVIQLNLGEPDFGAPPAVIEAAKRLMDGRSLAYTSALGLPELRQKIAEFYQQQHGVNIHPSRIIVTAGASAALLLLTAALVDHGDEVIVGDPSYPCNRQFLSSFGAKVNLVATDAASNYQLSSELVKSHWTAETTGLMIATPSNPTGTSIDIDELKQICEWARTHHAWRIIDEIYLNLADPDAEGNVPQTVLSFDSDAIVINSFSKYFGMTGWRLGWCVVPEKLVPILENMAQNYFICPSTIAQYALECFTEESLAVCEQRRLMFIERRNLVLAGLKQMGLPVPVVPNGAFYIYFDVRGTGLTAWQFCEQVLQEAHVALTPGKDFGVCGAEHYVRLSYAASTEQLSQAVQRLAQFMQQFSLEQQQLKQPSTAL
ncbi:aminotransferase class I/II-fold pyridoxal phosphate-dependent enzyme [Acinetobacter sp. MD2]|uniref:aminotransferase class I/II-fold pyridoxal phosphate-dependent enzyme n=1 Tax=Acinetobacter sp. MD2 TaxID=2600066 RepID=UPI002D1F737F|nr:aminotransferase class I/II-fold pyridoxal phosphate-dependent enzyme [Acinetobacter sp. MD2]MEB3767811.1 aminotransferase class I/II-fold pyridoxal phosphate-dependent enzyme [Acinetobacter sp. MD2]